MNFIDFHTHLFPESVTGSRDDYLSDPGFKLLYSGQGSRMADLNLIRGYLDDNPSAAGLAAMSFPWRDERNCLMHNEYMAMAAESCAGIYPFGMVPLSDPGIARPVCADIKASGLYGIGEIAFYDRGLDPGNTGYLRAVIEASIEFSLPVCLHLNEPVGHVYPGKYDPSLDRVYGLVKDYPDARIILSHWGGGLVFYELMPEVKHHLKNVYYDTAATPFLYSSGIYSAAVKIAGAGRILFGTDFPLLGPGRYIESIRQGVGADEFSMITYGNAAGILGINPAP